MDLKKLIGVTFGEKEILALRYILFDRRIFQF